MNEVFTIGDFCFRLISPDSVAPPQNFLKFRGGGEPAYTYTIETAEEFPVPAGTVLARREDMLVTRTETGECRHIGIKGDPKPYACYMETGPDSARVLLSLSRWERLNVDVVFASLLALERRQRAYGGLILHCAYMELDGEAILFSAPSETGKTTQANLWAKYRGTTTVNGDRALLQCVDGRWIARGWPVCGSSDVCNVKDLPIRAIVLLSQAPEDRIERIGGMKAFTQLYSQITVNRWDREAHLEMMERTERLISEVPVFHLACTMNERAVIALEKALR